MTHDLKITPAHYIDVFDGKRRAELRKNDRPYKIGDCLRLRAWNDSKNEYINVSPIYCIVTHIIHIHESLKSSYVMLSIVPLNNHIETSDYSLFHKSPSNEN